LNQFTHRSTVVVNYSTFWTSVTSLPVAVGSVNWRHDQQFIHLWGYWY